MGAILFSYNNVLVPIRNKRAIKVCLGSVFTDENKPFKRISYIFCDDNFLLALNKAFLNHDTLTDILTFPLSEPESLIESEIYISVERVKENATNLSIPFLEELNRVMIHGILHLCGYQDHTKAEKAKMRLKEDYYLTRVGST